MQDVVIIGGGYAGLSAALQIGRHRRQVTVIDNAVSRHANKEVGGKPPHELLGETILKLRPYANVRFIQAMALTVNGEADAFRVATTDGETIDARRVILSHGVVDLLPQIEGLAACWGRSVFDCRYRNDEACGASLGLLCGPTMSDHAKALVHHQREPMLAFSNGGKAPNGLDACKVRHVGGTIARLVHDGGWVQAVALDSGEEIAVERLFIEPRQVLSAGFHLDLGLATVETSRGRLIAVDETGETSLRGIFAAGDLASPRQTVMLAIADGSLAGTSCHHSLY